jgi:hypothetical protein
VRTAAARVRGLDVHPVAVIIARVTWLLALGDAVREREGPLHVPVYLGDAMQWDLSQIGGLREVMLPVPGEGPLHVPAGIAEDQAKFNPAVRELTEGLNTDASPEQVERALTRIPGIEGQDAALLAQTYRRLQALKQAGRNGIWPFVLRNLIRPVWLSRPDQRADVVIGNPPWVAYRHLSPEMKPRLRDACRAMNLWAGGVLATQQDISALFWARSIERYLKPRGTIAFVLAYAALNRPAFAGMRRGNYGSASVRITAGWSLAQLREILPNSACVLIGRRDAPGPLPTQVSQFFGTVRRDAGEAEADRSLRRELVPWPPMATLGGASPYRARFKQGATMVPRRFFLVEREPAGRLGASRAAPRVRGRQGSMDRRPWNRLAPPAGPVEVQFLRPLLLGESVAPFRLLDTALAVIPVEGQAVLDSEAAAGQGHRHLAAWLRDIEAKWAAHASRKADGSPRMTLTKQIDHMRKLSLQLAAPVPKVVYTASGTRLSAAMVEDPSVIIDTSLYWTPIRSLDEARFLCALINSDAALQRVIPIAGTWLARPASFS